MDLDTLTTNINGINVKSINDITAEFVAYIADIQTILSSSSSSTTKQTDLRDRSHRLQEDSDAKIDASTNTAITLLEALASPLQQTASELYILGEDQVMNFVTEAIAVEAEVLNPSTTAPSASSGNGPSTPAPAPPVPSVPPLTPAQKVQNSAIIYIAAISNLTLQEAAEKLSSLQKPPSASVSSADAAADSQPSAGWQDRLQNNGDDLKKQAGIIIDNAMAGIVIREGFESVSSSLERTCVIC